MPHYVVLLRGVNVGKAQRVPMATFKSLLQELGFTGVQTLLNSGNAVGAHSGRSAPALAIRVRQALMEGLQLDVPVIVKSAADFNAAVAGNPAPHVPEAEHSRLMVTFAPEPAALQALGPLLALVQAPETLQIGPHAAYLHCASGILQSKAAAALLGKVGRGVTTRNWATVLKIQAALAHPAQAESLRRQAQV